MNPIRPVCPRARLPLVLAGLLVLLAAGTGPASAQAWPAKPIRLIVPWPAGGFADVRARPLGERMARSLGQNVVIDNRPGASGSVGVAAGARAAPDGYTVTLISINDSAIAPALNPALPYDVLRDFDPVLQVARNALVLIVHPGLEARTLDELKARARARGGPLLYASNGAASTGHVAGELLSQSIGVALRHVPYKGTAPALMAIVSGEVRSA